MNTDRTFVAKQSITIQADCAEQECALSEKNWASVLAMLRELLEKQPERV